RPPLTTVVPPSPAAVDQPRKLASARQHRRYSPELKLWHWQMGPRWKTATARYPTSDKFAYDVQAWRLRRFRSSTTATISASTMSATNVSYLVLCLQPNLACALLASPSRVSTSVSRK